MAIPSKKKNSGFTLIELLIVLTIFSVLAGLAAPSMKGLIEARRTLASSRTLLMDLEYARSEAVSRSTDVTVCASLDGATCSGSNVWATGWVVSIVDVNDCPAAGECVLRIEENRANSINFNSSVNSLTYNGFGEVSSAGSFIVCGPDLNNTQHARTITLHSSGSRTMQDNAASCIP